MRSLLAVAFAVLALWRGWIDWHATISKGYAFRLASVEDVFRSIAPGTFRGIAESIQALGVPWLWDPVARFVFALPLAVIPAVIALILWITRPRARGRV